VQYAYFSSESRVYYASVTRQNTLQTVTKGVYLITVMDSVFCLGRACYKQTRSVSSVTLDWSEIMGVYNAADTVMTDRKSK